MMMSVTTTWRNKGRCKICCTTLPGYYLFFVFEQDKQIHYSVFCSDCVDKQRVFDVWHRELSMPPGELFMKLADAEIGERIRRLQVAGEEAKRRRYEEHPELVKIDQIVIAQVFGEKNPGDPGPSLHSG